MHKQLIPLKDVVLVTQYYPPEIGGGSQRSVGFAEELNNNGISVNVVTPFPSYLMSKDQVKTKYKLYEKNEEHGITIFRTFVYASDRGNFLKRILYYLSFTISSSIVVLLVIPKVKYIITISPPLFTGLVGVFSKIFKSSKFIFDIGDLWPESAIQLGFLNNKTAIYLSRKLEKLIYNKSDLINVVTRKTQEKLKSILNETKKIIYVPNFVETDKFIRSKKDDSLLVKLNLNKKFIAGYAGNIGGAQGIKIIIDAAKMTEKNNNIVYIIIGDGVDKDKVRDAIEKHKLKNVLLLPPISRKEIVKYVQLFDCMIIPLVKNPLFEITIPSKLYESMSSEIPILLGVDGEARKILELSNSGLFFEPENSFDLASKVVYFYENRVNINTYGASARKYTIENFDRKNVIKRFVEELKNI
jgi:glycosyltransferase involved in cell wall biosynthesis